MSNCFRSVIVKMM